MGLKLSFMKREMVSCSRGERRRTESVQGFLSSFAFDG